MITINNKYNSSDLLFSIPVHEKQDIVNNSIENIFNFNPNCKIILHINKTFKDFNPKLSNYHNLYFNRTNITYNKGEDLLAYHISNFNYCINNNIEFEYFILLASNELFIKNGAVEYIHQSKNGTQIININNNIDWHNFKKSIETNEYILELFENIHNNELCGGQAEGQFFQKNIFTKISELYLNITNNYNIQLPFEAEEIIPQTILNSLHVNYQDPITLQNYTNNIEFSTQYINELINGIIIQSKSIKNQLISPHLDKSSNNIYSIKRVDRDFNKIRKYLSKKGFILNLENYIYNTYYYSNNSSLFINSHNEIFFKKNNNELKDFQWFGFFLKKGFYSLSFEYKTEQFINPYIHCGLKIHYPFHYIISNFFENNQINSYKKVNIPLTIHNDQNIIFIFDDYFKKLDIHFKNIEFKENVIIQNENQKKNIILVLYKNNNNLCETYDNIKNFVINIFEKIYNVYIIVILNTNNHNEKYIIKNFNPHSINHETNINFKNIIKCTNDFIKKYKLDFQFILISNLDLIYLKIISNINIIINKINFLSYQYNNNDYDVNTNICLIPYQYFETFLKYKSNHILQFLKNKKLNYSLIIPDFYYKNNKIVNYHSIINNIKNNGFIFEENYKKQILYYNHHCFFKKIENNYFYFFKKYTYKYQEFIWCGYNLKFSKESNSTISLKITFELKLNNPIFIQKNIGLKTHYPTQYVNDFLKKNNLNLNNFIYHELTIDIQKKNQLIIFNFDNLFDELEFEIKNLTLIYNSN